MSDNNFFQKFIPRKHDRIKKCDNINNCNVINYQRTVIHKLNKRVTELENIILSLKGELKLFKGKQSV